MTVILRIRSPWALRFLAAAPSLRQSKPWITVAGRLGRLTAAAAAGLALSTATVTEAPAVRQRPVITVLLKQDPRAARLEKFFKYYHCATPYHAFEYLRAADGYGLDYRLLPAVSIRETLCGATSKQLNNPWGYHPGRQSFTSIAEGIEVIAKRLTQHPLYRGKTLQDKLFTYNPRAAYPKEVERIMRQIE